VFEQLPRDRADLGRVVLVCIPKKEIELKIQ